MQSRSPTPTAKRLASRAVTMFTQASPGTAASMPALVRGRWRLRRDPPTGHDRGADADPMRLLSRRPRVQLKSLEAVDLGGVLDLLDRTLDDHAPAGLGCGLDPVDLERGLARQQQRREFRPACRTEDDRLRAAIEDVGDRTNDRRRTPVRRTHRQPAEPRQGQELDALGALELCDLTS